MGSNEGLVFKNENITGPRKAERGQSLIELLIAVSVAGIFIGGIAVTLSTALRTSSQNKFVQAASLLAKEELDAVAVVARSNWRTIGDLATSPARHYVNVAAEPLFTVANNCVDNCELKNVDGVDYRRYFTVASVSRDASDNIEAAYQPIDDDPSTKLITSLVTWGADGELKLEKYITRSENNVSIQTDWSGGPPIPANGNFLFSDNPAKFVSVDAAIDYGSKTGSLTLEVSAPVDVLGAIDDTNHWAWNDVIGWFDFKPAPTVGHPGVDYVKVGSNELQGYAASTVGEVALNCDPAMAPLGSNCDVPYKVTNDGNGNLGGYAWNENIGWISFWCGNAEACGSSNYRVTIDVDDGDFHGFAWNDLAGWISFNCEDVSGVGSCPVNYKVQTTWRPAISSTSGELVSSVFDAGVVGGVKINSVLWRGLQPTDTSVGWQIASADLATGPWAYLGPNNSPTDFYWGTVGASVGVSPRVAHQDKRYFRYKLKMQSANAFGASPQVDDVIINWSR